MKDPLVRLTFSTQTGSNPAAVATESQVYSIQVNRSINYILHRSQKPLGFISTCSEVYLISDCICTVLQLIVCIQCTVYTYVHILVSYLCYKRGFELSTVSSSKIFSLKYQKQCDYFERRGQNKLSQLTKPKPYRKGGNVTQVTN